MIKWPSLKFQPINLWSAPRQEIDYLRKEVEIIPKEIACDIELAEHFYSLSQCSSERLIRLRKRLKEREFIYYTRTGRFPATIKQTKVIR